MLMCAAILVMLFALHSDEGDEFQFDLHMSGPQGAAEGGSECGVCELWVQRLCLERLVGTSRTFWLLNSRTRWMI